ncbi:MAG: hypothetical protein LBQ50_00610 [Planctomycetaceae bacterium]|jgi:hypothetical protein|nr:hypothetical protein [Planctomycetaceae bacterium]
MKEPEILRSAKTGKKLAQNQHDFAQNRLDFLGNIGKNVPLLFVASS